ncbi:hypothetical protein QQF64_025217 [Cirrhinus molitorella]|uniref:Secreted protein n=1 Tax=Cirrhinus molitorella TaxID=172907 RepID=A0ABR3NNQ9_9TELE
MFSRDLLLLSTLQTAFLPLLLLLKTAQVSPSSGVSNWSHANSAMRSNVVHLELTATKTQARCQEIHLPPPLKPRREQFHYANHVEFCLEKSARGMMDV